MSEIVFQGRQTYVQAALTDSRMVVVTLNHAPERGEAIPFAAKYLARVGVSAVYIVAKSRHWWQTECSLEAVAIAAALLTPFRQRVGYSGSMGGYGVLLFAKRLGLHRAVVASPQTTISDPDVPLAEGWGVASVLHDDVPGALGIVPHILYDPRMPIDRAHVAWLKRSHPVHELYTPYSGHGSLRVLKEGGVLTAFANEFVIGSATNERFRPMYQAARRFSPTYRRELQLRGRTLCLDAA